MTRPTVLLFDIDGTLLLSGGAGRRAISRAFDEVIGAPEVLDNHDFRGMTDRTLFRAGLAAAGRSMDAALLERLLDAYIRFLRPELVAAGHFRVLPGVVPLLDALVHRDAVALGIGTGNVEQGAWLKLERGRLDHYFEFGGFGDDVENRAELVRCGVARGAARLGCAPADCRVVVIGDSVHDVRAAHDVGADCVAVQTGGHPRDELLALGATHVFETLAAPSVLPVLLAQ